MDSINLRVIYLHLKYSSILWYLYILVCVFADTNDTYVILVRAARLRPRINLGVWTCALMYGTMHIPSMQRLAKPSFLELLPYRSLPLPVIEAAVKQAGETGKKVLFDFAQLIDHI